MGLHGGALIAVCSKTNSTMADGVERVEQRHLCCGWMRAIVKVTKNMVHTKQKHTRHIHLRF
jgi:hypothetical protein